MQNVPQFALKRLKEMPPAAGSHPDADMLTAFAEQSLAGDERARVMEHLAACGDCRDVIALALPATEIVAMPASANSARIGWLSWPALRWGALAAGSLAVTSVGVLHYSHRNQQETVACTSLGCLGCGNPGRHVGRGSALFASQPARDCGLKPHAGRCGSPIGDESGALVPSNHSATRDSKKGIGRAQFADTDRAQA